LQAIKWEEINLNMQNSGVSFRIRSERVSERTTVCAANGGQMFDGLQTENPSLKSIKLIIIG